VGQASRPPVSPASKIGRPLGQACGSPLSHARQVGKRPGALASCRRGIVTRRPPRRQDASAPSEVRAMGTLTVSRTPRSRSHLQDGAVGTPRPTHGWPHAHMRRFGRVCIVSIDSRRGAESAEKTGNGLFLCELGASTRGLMVCSGRIGPEYAVAVWQGGGRREVPKPTAHCSLSSVMLQHRPQNR